MSLCEIEETIIDERCKGFPRNLGSFKLGDIAAQGLNLLDEDFTLPMMVLKDEALRNNRQWMSKFLELSGVKLAPHAKTHMAPQFLQMQMEDGAWGICAATVDHVQIYRRFGFNRILMANQLVGKQNINYILNELKSNPEFDFYCLVDSIRGVELLLQAAEEEHIGRPLKLLIEVGVGGGRAGCLGKDEAVNIARRIKENEPLLVLAGVEGYEGAYLSSGKKCEIEQVEDYLDTLAEVAQLLEKNELYGVPRLVISAGCTSYFDLVWKKYQSLKMEHEFDIVIRSGCYLTLDSGAYAERFEIMMERSPELKSLGSGLTSAFELWGYVQSMPDASTAIVTLGRRDCPFDKGLPIPEKWYRPGEMERPQEISPEHKVTALNDQHCIMEVASDTPLQVGDMVGLGVSHPCAAFERWLYMPVVDRDYNVISLIKSFF
jgi:D-serine deaminase-like pyridoxal phosphate-dependent protein